MVLSESLFWRSVRLRIDHSTFRPKHRVHTVNCLLYELFPVTFLLEEDGLYVLPNNYHSHRRNRTVRTCVTLRSAVVLARARLRHLVAILFCSMLLWHFVPSAIKLPFFLYCDISCSCNILFQRNSTSKLSFFLYWDISCSCNILFQRNSPFKFSFFLYWDISCSCNVLFQRNSTSKFSFFLYWDISCSCNILFQRNSTSKFSILWYLVTLTFRPLDSLSNQISP